MNFINNVKEWSFDGWGHIQSPDEGAGALGSPETALEFITKTRPLVEKYGLVMTECDCDIGEIDIQNEVIIPGKKIEEFFEDFQTFLDIIAAYKLKSVGYTDCLVSNDSIHPAKIVFSVDDKGKLQKSYTTA
ncbi:MAG: hypothetical protein IKR90_07655 [Clostridia bacterium]|nr:hypothetical protein [Clostridia bacterium]